MDPADLLYLQRLEAAKETTETQDLGLGQNQFQSQSQSLLTNACMLSQLNDYASAVLKTQQP